MSESKEEEERKKRFDDIWVVRSNYGWLLRYARFDRRDGAPFPIVCTCGGEVKWQWMGFIYSDGFGGGVKHLRVYSCQNGRCPAPPLSDLNPGQPIGISDIRHVKMLPGYIPVELPALSAT